MQYDKKLDELAELIAEHPKEVLPIFDILDKMGKVPNEEIINEFKRLAGKENPKNGLGSNGGNNRNTVPVHAIIHRYAEQVCVSAQGMGQKSTKSN